MNTQWSISYMWRLDYYAHSLKELKEQVEWREEQGNIKHCGSGQS